MSAAALVAVVSLSCQEQEAEAPVSESARSVTSDARTRPSATELEQLRELGYSDWDEDADLSLRSVVHFDPERASAGYNLYTNDVDEVYLIDLKGERLHSWQLPGRKHCEYAELFQDGTLWVVCGRHSLVKLGWDSRILWERKMMVHHDLARGPDHSVLVSFILDRVKYHGRMVKFDGIMRVTPAGETELFWSSYAQLEALKKFHHPSELDVAPTFEMPAKPGRLFDYYHLNTIEILPKTTRHRSDSPFRAGNILICLRNVNLIAILDQDDFSVVWSWGIDDLDAPHMPTLLENGNILIYDNGYSRNYSRVIELDPITLEIVWSYQANPKSDFFSARRGSSQRLDNGNTLISDAERGRAFEVTRAGEVVWDFWNPEILDGKRKQIYRFMRLQPAMVDPLLRER